MSNRVPSLRLSKESYGSCYSALQSASIEFEALVHGFRECAFVQVELRGGLPRG